MKTRILFSVLAAVVLFGVPGCSGDDDNPVNPGDDSRINLEFKLNSQFTYDRSDLDSNNVQVPGSKRSYVVEYKGSGGVLVGAYADWIRRVGTDGASGAKDTLFIRATPGSKDGVPFSRDVMVYGFVNKLLNAFVDRIEAQFPGIPRPSIAGPQWDIIAKYHAEDGAALPVGTEWVIGNDQGADLNFVFPGVPTPISINVTMKGKLDSRGETFTVSGKSIKTWKTTVTATARLLTSTADVKLSFWFSDDPDGQIRFEQRSAKLIVPFVNIAFPISGELQELTSYK